MAGVRSIRGEDGANAVEFALVLPILLVMIFGMLTGGIVLFQKLGVEQGNREAARWAATLPLEDCGGPASPPADCWFADVANRAVAGAGGELNAGVKGREICVAYIHADAAASPPVSASKSMTWDANAGPPLSGANAHSTGTECFPSTVSPDTPHVQVRVSRVGRFDLIFYGNDVTLESQSVALYEPEPVYP